MAKLTATGVGSNARRFWAVADFFRKAGPSWMPANAGYECWRAMEGGGQSWSACLKLHVVPGPKRNEFKASITLWPSVGHGEANESPETPWHLAVKKALRGEGYRGAWTKSPHGTFGDFWKDLAGPGAVRREAKLLEALELPSPTAAPRRRASQRRVRRGGSGSG